MTGWREQYDRMLRSHEQLGGIADGRIDASSDEARDALFHFYQDAYHLKDWLKYDRSAQIGGKDIENFITCKKRMSVLADLCNGTKHLVLDRPRTGDASTSFTAQAVTVRPATVGDPTSRQPARHQWRVTSGGKSWDALDLAEKVLRSWNKWLRKKQLL